MRIARYYSLFLSRMRADSFSDDLCRNGRPGAAEALGQPGLRVPRQFSALRAHPAPPSCPTGCRSNTAGGSGTGEGRDPGSTLYSSSCAGGSVSGSRADVAPPATLVRVAGRVGAVPMR